MGDFSKQGGGNISQALQFGLKKIRNGRNQRTLTDSNLYLIVRNTIIADCGNEIWRRGRVQLVEVQYDLFKFYEEKVKLEIEYSVFKEFFPSDWIAENFLFKTVAGDTVTKLSTAQQRAKTKSAAKRTEIGKPPIAPKDAALDGADLMQIFKDEKNATGNDFLPAWNTCVNKDGTVQSGKQLEDAIKGTLLIVHNAAEDERLVTFNEKAAALRKVSIDDRFKTKTFEFVLSVLNLTYPDGPML
jgi:hypothetical protein